MIYVGVHKTNDPYDDYLGSGKFILSAIESDGVDNFKKDILYYCDSKDEMYLKESEIVNKDFVSREDTYNICLGGDGGWDHIDHTALWKDPVYRNKQLASREKAWQNPKYKENLIKALHDPNYRKNMEKTWQDPDVREKRINGMKRAYQNPDIRENKSQSAKKRWQDPSQRKRQSESRKGGTWVHCPETNIKKYIHKDESIPKGFVKGMKPKTVN